MESNLPQVEKSEVTYSNMQRWLILMAAVIAVAADRLVLAPNWCVEELALVWGGFWAIYLVAFYICTWRVSSRSIAGWVMVAAFAYLTLRSLIYQSATMLIVCALATPPLLMAHAIVCTHKVERGREVAYVGRWFVGCFAYPFWRIGRLFGAIGSLFKKGNRGLGIGLAVGIPLLAVVIVLLATSDAVIGGWFTAISAGAAFIEWFFHLSFIFLTFLLFYSFIYSVSYDRLEIAPSEAKTPMLPVTGVVIISLLLAAYAAFTAVQFTYLTGLAGLPDGLTYSEYAVAGFWQLVVVAIINFAVYGVTMCLSADFRGKRWLLLALMVSNGAILFSAIKRLTMYIGAYGLTTARILAMWFMIFLAAATLMCIVKIFVRRMRLFVTGAAVFLCWFIALSSVNVDAMIAQSIVAKSEERGHMTSDDENMLYSLSSDADAVIAGAGDIVPAEPQRSLGFWLVNRTDREFVSVELHNDGGSMGGSNADGSSILTLEGSAYIDFADFVGSPARICVTDADGNVYEVAELTLKTTDSGREFRLLGNNGDYICLPQ